MIVMCKRRQPSELRLEGFDKKRDFKYMTIRLKFCFQLARSRDKKLVLPKGASNNRMDSIPVRIAETWLALTRPFYIAGSRRPRR
jgi:hypothetical protein